MSDDETKALRWLLGRGSKTEQIRPALGKRIDKHVGEGADRAALVRVLRRQEPIGHDLRNAIANAFEGLGSSEMTLQLVLVRRAGRGRPRGSVKKAVEQLRFAKICEREIARRVKLETPRDVAIGDTAKHQKKARSTVFAALAAAKEAKVIRENT
jgi:hypothetical protein